MKTITLIVAASTLWLSGTTEVTCAQDNSRSNIADGAQAVTHQRMIKPLANGATNLNRSKKRTENAKQLDVTLSYDEKTQSVGAYDRPVIAEVEKHWHDLLDKIKPESTGKVVLQFYLHPDGRVTELKLLESTVSDAIGEVCKQAVLDSSPFPRWPKEMHKQIAADTRRMTLTFHYPPDDANRIK